MSRSSRLPSHPQDAPAASRPSDDVIAARKAARTYQACLLAGFALPCLGLLAVTFIY